MKSATIFLTLCFLSKLASAQDTTTNTEKPFWKKIHVARHTNQSSDESTLPIDPGSNKVAYKEVVTIDKATKSALFEKAKQWAAAKGSSAYPYTVTLENEDQGSVVAKGAFMLPTRKRNYVVQFTASISVKQGKFRYELTDIMLQLETDEGSKGFGYGPFSSHSHKKAVLLEYTLETFYPARLTSRQPAVKYFEEVNAESFATINKEMQSLAGSLKQSLSGNGASDW